MSDNFLYSDSTLVDLAEWQGNSKEQESIELYFKQENKLYVMFKEAGPKRYFSKLHKEDVKLVEKALMSTLRRSSSVFPEELYCIGRSKRKSEIHKTVDVLYCYMDLNDVQLPFNLLLESPFSEEIKVFTFFGSLMKKDNCLPLTEYFDVRTVYNLLLKDYEDFIKQRNFKTKIRNMAKTDSLAKQLEARQRELRALRKLILERCN